MGNQKIVVAIDGPSGSGKGTVARATADRLGYFYIDSGAMYRAVALCAQEQRIALSDTARVAEFAEQLNLRMESAPEGMRVLASGRDVTEAIRRPEVSQGASQVAVIPAVRAVLVAQQQRMGTEGGIVMEGRDIGTVVFPRAELKVFLDASAAERVRRRYRQQREQGIECTVEATRKEIEERDRRDRERTVSPLVQAADAVYLDTTALTVEEVADVVVRLAREREAKTGKISPA